MTHAVELINLSKRFGTHEAVRQLNLQIPMGCFYALLGTNGAGKTTTLRMVSGLTEPDQGDALICGHSIRRHPIPAKQVMAYIPDERVVRDMLLDYVRQGNTVIMTTHIMEIAEQLADHISIMYEGVILAEGTLIYDSGTSLQSYRSQED
jgi:ABC-type multidrug transport system ATPase subunit